MDQDNVDVHSDVVYPIPSITEMPTKLETKFDINDFFVERPVNQACIKSPNKYDAVTSVDNNEMEQMPSILSEDDQMCTPLYNQSQVWIDPTRSPYVFNDFASPIKESLVICAFSAYNHYASSSEKSYAFCDPSGSNSKEQHKTNLSQGGYNLSKFNVCNNLQEPGTDFELMNRGEISETDIIQQDSDTNIYNEDEFGSNIFLSLPPEEIMNRDVNYPLEELNSVGHKSEKSDSKEPLPRDIQLMQKRALEFLRNDFEIGQTFKKMFVCGPMTKRNNASVEKCNKAKEDASSSLGMIYKCDKCTQTFAQHSAYRQHTVRDHPKVPDSEGQKKMFICTKCRMILKNQCKFDRHYLGHGNPELECDTCHKVYSTKFSLRAHKKIHNRVITHRDRNACDVDSSD